MSESVFDASKRVTKEMMTHVMPSFKPKGDEYQLEISIYPLISNAMHHRDKEILEEERWRTIETLAKSGHVSDFHSVMKELGYKLKVEK